jgi:hypothetical protein
MKFKVGDWVMVIQNSAPILYQGYYEIPHRITEISNCIIVDEDTPLGFSECNLKLWQPKVGEYCWSQVGEYRIPTVIKVTQQHIDEDWLNSSNCEPFIGTLPSFIKEL